METLPLHVQNASSPNSRPPLHSRPQRPATASTNTYRVDSRDRYVDGPLTWPVAPRGLAITGEIRADETSRTRVPCRQNTMSSRSKALYNAPCAITDERAPVEVAHLIPISASDNTVLLSTRSVRR